METIVIGFDGSETSAVALEWVAERVARHPAQVEIVMIGGSVLQDDFRLEARLVEAERRLRFRVPGAQVGSHRFTGRMPDSLLESAGRAGLLVVGSHRGRPVWSALTGWKPLRVTSRSRTPVVVVPDDWTAVDGKVVVGLDDDDSSLAAVDLAAREAAASQVPLVLVHTWRMPAPRMEGSVALLASPIEVRAVHRKLLREAGQDAISRHPDLVLEQVLERNSPSSALLVAARTASLLVIGTHHRGFFAGMMLGSVGQDVLSESRVPVCVVPGHHTE